MPRLLHAAAGGRLGFGEANFAEAIWAAPVAGAVVGLVAGAAFAVAAWFGLPPSLSAIVALAAAILVTGSLHEDGVADIADGFGGGNTRERKLEIMRDSRNGTFGVVALVMVAAGPLGGDRRGRRAPAMRCSR